MKMVKTIKILFINNLLFYSKILLLGMSIGSADDDGGFSQIVRSSPFVRQLEICNKIKGL